MAISPQLPEYSRELTAQHRLDFPLLQDNHNEVARKFGLVFRLPEELRSIYRKIGVDLENYNGDASWELPIPASYVIGQDGLIEYASVDVDYTVRPEPDDIILAIKKL